MIKIMLILMTAVFMPSEQETPQYFYTCMEDGRIVLRGFSEQSSIEITNATHKGAVISLPEACKQLIKDDKLGHILIPAECSNGTDSSEDRIITFKSFDSGIDEVTAPPSPAVPYSAGQDHHNFKIECKKIQDGGVQNHVIGHIGVGDEVNIQQNFNDIGRVEMRFKSEKAESEAVLNNLPDTSTVFIGDKFYMYLKYMGSQDYKISPQTCIAFGGNTRAVAETVTTQNSVVLWTRENCASLASKNYHLMRNFVNLDNKIVYVEMYGFNFATNGDVTIQCDVTVCRKDDKNKHCNLNAKCSNSATWRMKRNTGVSRRSVKATGTLQIRSRDVSDYNAAGVLRPGWLFILTTLLFISSVH